MKTQMKRIARLIPITLLWLILPSAHAENWYYSKGWTKTGGSLVATNGGLSTPYGVAMGPDGKVYVGDEGYGRIQVYQPDGTYAFSITNGFGGGQSFSQPRGMLFGPDDNLYVADTGRSRIFVFSPTGTLIRTIGDSSGPGLLSAILDVGVSRDGEVYVLQNYRVSVFSATGGFLRVWGSYGTLSAQLYNPRSIAVAPGGKVYISTQANTTNGLDYGSCIKIFSPEGMYLGKFELGQWYMEGVHSTWAYVCRLPCCLRFDYSGLLHVTAGYFQAQGDRNYVTHYIMTSEGSTIYSSDFLYSSTFADITLTWPCAAVGKDGTVMVFIRNLRTGYQFDQVFREGPMQPRNAIPQPLVFRTQQRPGTTIVDIDYQVTDMDDTNIYAAAVVFKNAVGNFSNCIRNLTLIENTATNLGPGITANQPHRITWNAGADWSTSLGNYKVALLAKDSRTNLLDIYYLRLPAGNGMPDLTISRSPLTQSDYSLVWWWLVASGDADINLATQRIIGVSGAYSGQVLYEQDRGTSLSGRTFLHEKMNLREATAAEVNWARQGALPGNTNRWSRGGPFGRPTYVNEFGFDTTDWGTNAFWVVPLN